MLKKIDFTKLPITEIVSEIIYTAAEAGASDIHFDPSEDDIKVRFRIDGVLIDYAIIPENIRKNLVARLKIISGMDITESRLPQDGSIKTMIKDINLDMRVSSLPTNEGEKIVIRILDYTASLKGLESLGFSPSNYQKMKRLIALPNGIILVTGATGSGKSTTVYSVLQILNSEKVNLVTVEDPVEMSIEGINQIQVNSEIGLTFANVLRSILRQDPDIIMIGEIRDDETAKIAVRASITGHLVLSTIHTNNALNTIERLTDMDVERYLLASSLNGIVSQKLARKICPHCMKKRPAIDYEKKLIKENLGVDITELSYAQGCDECVGGYKGRIAIHEVLVITQEIRDAIANGMPKDELRPLVYTKNTTTLLQDGLQKVLQNITTIEEILRIVELDDKNSEIVKVLDKTQINATQTKSSDSTVELKTPPVTTNSPTTFNNNEVSPPPLVINPITKTNTDEEFMDI
ncbi:MAG: GspE/PulE family protein [Bacilli bacterium]